MAKKWYFLLEKHCQKSSELDCPLQRLTDRTIKGSYTAPCILSFTLRRTTALQRRRKTIHFTPSILKLRQCEIVRDGDRYRPEAVERQTGKRSVFTVPMVICQYIENYCLRNRIGRTELMLPITQWTNCGSIRRYKTTHGFYMPCVVSWLGDRAIDA